MTNDAPRARQRVRVLPPELADQIAAGEVVERPASVVKELVENALDAGARRIDVEIEAGGRRLVRVVDDGVGMDPDDARLALRRHATSKIASADDLWGLRTFGFRGEALPSIAAVSRLTLATRPADAAAGFKLTVEAGVESDAREVGIPVGTQVEVRDLFFNTPARAKFGKSEATETANVSEAMLRLALAHPEAHLRLRVAGRVAMDLPPHASRGERVRAALARRGAGALHEADGEEGGCRVQAYLAGPDESTNTTRNTFLFVGGRFVRDRNLLHALTLGYGPLLEKGRYPMAALFLDVPGADVDVNVHPQKLEVRFARAQEVYAAVRHVVGAAIARAPWLRTADDRPMRTFTQPPVQMGTLGGSPYPPATDYAGQSPAPSTRSWRGRSSGGAMTLPRAAQSSLPLRVRDADDGEGGTGAPVEAPSDQAPRFFAGLTYVGQVHRTYLVCEAADELILIDQHAAHERVAYARLRAAHARRQMPRQQLLFPIPIDVGEAAAAALDGDDTLGGLGFEVSREGPAGIILRAVPEPLKDADPKPLIRELLTDLADGTPLREGELDRVDHLLATIACHSVVRAGDVLGRPEALALLSQLDAVDLRSHCPHGRPVLLRLPLGEIERRFGRA
ncbi:MAG TPA: DNA mismatch repair endonuclease MutL [Polyangia bacterium]|nr:DNA mismatch repair endonuclease MutL [Polyangia bacterium]